MTGRILSIVAAVTIAHLSSLGCSFFGGTPTDNWKRANQVFVGRVLRAEGAYPTLGPVTFLVEEAFKGTERGATITAGAGEPRCGGILFHESERYLLFLRPAPAGSLPDASRLSGTIDIDEAPAVLRWLRGRSRPGWNAQVLGRVLVGDDPTFTRKVRPLAGAKVKIAGNDRQVTATSDSEGLFQIGGLPPGEYRISSSYPGLDIRENYALIGECCEFRDVFTWVDGHVGGIVRNAEGTPLPDVRVELASAQNSASLSPFRDVKTNREGEFQFRGIPPGEYELGVNVLSQPTADQPFPKTMRQITLSVREQLAGLELKMPPALPPREVLIKVWSPDGRGVPNATVVIQSMPGYAAPVQLKTNTDGEASITWIQQAAFRAYAEVRTSSGPSKSSDWLEISAGDQPIEIGLSLKIRNY